MAFIDALAALSLNRRDLANGQSHCQAAIRAGRPAETIYANLCRRQYRPAPRRRRAQPFRGPRSHRRRVRFAAALRRLRQSRKGARATSGPRAAPARFSSGASAVMPKQQADTRCALAAVARRTRGTDVIELKRVAACLRLPKLTTNRSINASIGCCDADSCETLVRLYLGTGTEVWAFYYSSTTRSAETPEPFPRTRSPQHRDSKLKFRRARSRPIASRGI